MILAIDPGLRHCGCAALDAGGLIAAALVKNTDTGRGPAAALAMATAVGAWSRKYGAVKTLVLEYPRIYVDQQRRAANDPNDLVELACVDGALAAWFSVPVRHYYPSDWKGQTPANPTARQVMKRLNALELARVEKFDSFFEALLRAEARGKDVTHTTHNTLDAVGIGLKYLGRF